MKKTLSLAVILTCLALGCSNNDDKVAELETKLAENQEQVAKIQAESASTTASNVELNKKLEQLASALSTVANQRNALAAELEKVKANQKLSDNTASQSPSLPEGLEMPKVVEVDGPGNTKVTTFYIADLKSPNGQSLGKALTFSQAVGKRLIFRRQDGPPIAVDADTVHPFILAAMNLSPEDLNDQQNQLDEKKRLQDAAGRESYARKLAADNLSARANAEMELRKAAIQAEQSQQAAQIALQAEAIRNDRMRAEAAMRQADAAMQAAQKEPTPSTVILNQNNQNGRSQGFWFNGVYYPR
jgi:myosin heavy subunit